MNEKLLTEQGWTQVIAGRVARKPEISFSKGKAKYVKFNKSFLISNDLANKEYYVTVFIKRVVGKISVGFIFSKSKKSGALKLSKNLKSGSGYISGSSTINQIKDDLKDKEKLAFTPEVQNIGEDEIYIIEIKK